MTGHINDSAVGDREEFRVLIVDDEQLYARAIARDIKRRGIECDVAFCAAEAMDLVEKGRYAAILLDHKLPDDDGIRMIPQILARQMSATVIVMTAYEAISNAIQALRQGADDYLVKETSIQPMVNAVLDVRRRFRVLAAGSNWDEHEKDGLLGGSPVMANVRDQLTRVSRQRETTVILTGETGVGKEVAARWLHAQSGAPESPFIAVDCVALPSPLVESLLFGHEKGAFTGADASRDGAFSEAGKGTIFLDEIGEMDLALQGKLLRVLESRRFHRVGSVREKQVRARVVAATNRDLLEQVKRGRFRFDLYQRLSVFPIQIPPLRDRGEDVLVLARHFVGFFARKMKISIRPLSAEIERRLMSYDYPGNVRELKNVIERAIILADDGSIEPRHIPDRILRAGEEQKPSTARGNSLPFDFIPGVDTLQTLEVKMIRHAMQQAHGVKAEAARLLGISRYQLLRRLEKHGIETD
ncbi:MAG: sigma-54-dependent Fis family transcriptional regulator [Deltaproteobacteria bacterium]|nr:sigma-54-dependent Fis family transcriptional regulator [Deltaproteobacteria bacterium]